MAVRKPPTLNGTQTADMAFIMVCFFMMVTTMGSEFGLIRMLPPWVEDHDAVEPINRRNVFIVGISQNNELLVQNEHVEVRDIREMVKEFFDLSNDCETCPEKEYQELPYIGNIKVNKGALVSLQNDRSTGYRIYIQVQNEIAAAINELRDDFSMQRFGMKYDDLTSTQQEVVGRQVYPMAISEAEPRNISRIH